MIVTRTCPYCGKRHEKIQLNKDVIVSYDCKGLNISYSIKKASCNKCNGKIVLPDCYPFLNIIVKTIVAYFQEENELVQKYIKQINFEIERLRYYAGGLEKISEKLKLDDFLIKINELLEKYNEIATSYNRGYFFSSNITCNYSKFEPELNIIKISSVIKYLKIIQKIQNENYFTWFRGHSNVKYKLVPSIFRNKDNKLYELKVMQYFMQSAAAFTSKCPKEEDWIKWLPFMQHYELHTRLLDWTDSPLCALFFALDKGKSTQKEDDAAVFVFNPEKWNNEHHNIQNSNLKVHGIPILDFTLNRKVNLMAESAFKEFYMPFELYPVAISTIRKHDRMYNQQANFTLHDSAIDMYKLCPEAFTKIIIPKKYKAKMREELLNMGIDKTTFFPELTALAEVANQRIK